MARKRSYSPEVSSLQASRGMFLLQFLRRPLQVGSVVPSSEALTRSMLQDLTSDQVRTYVEFGPGTGSFTRHAFEILPQIERSFLFEINPIFQELLQRHFPLALVHHDPSELLLPLYEQADLVISGLPFTNISWTLTQETLDEAYRMLKKGGSFRTFLYFPTFYLPKNQLLRAYMQEKFDDVRVRFVAQNFPPAFVIEGRK